MASLLTLGRYCTKKILEISPAVENNMTGLGHRGGNWRVWSFLSGGETMVSPRNFVDSVFRWVLQCAWQLESFVGVYIYFFENKYYRKQLTGLGLHVFSMHVCYVWMCVCVCSLCLDSILGMKTTENFPNSVAQSWSLLVKVISSETIRCLGGNFREAVFWQNWTLRTWLGSSNTVFYGRGCNIKTWPCF